MQPETDTQHFGKFTIFLLIKTTQASYGVKNGDYYRYRRYCSRKVLKLRKTINYKYGTKNKHIKKDIASDKGNDKKILQILLFFAEKFWAYGNECKITSTLKKNQNSRARFLAIKKLKRAYQWSVKLYQICKAKTDETTQMEAEAYSLFLLGMSLFEQENWKQSQSRLIASREIILDLIKNCDTITEKVYKEKIDQIDQTIKFCNFKMSKGKEMPIEQIIEIRKLRDPNLSNMIQSLTERRLKEINIDEKMEIRFKDERYAIKDESLIVQKQKIDRELENLEVIKKKSLSALEDEQLYEELLNFYSGIILLVDEGLKMTDIRKDSKEQTKGQIEVFKKIGLLLQEMKLNIFIDRNKTIFKHSFYVQKGRKSTPQTLAKILSNISTQYNQLIDIEKEKSDLADSYETKRTQALNAESFYTKTLRLMLVAQVYFNNEKHREAFSLWRECERCLKMMENQQETVDQLLELKKIQQNVRIGKLKCLLDYGEIQEKNREHVIHGINEMTMQEKQQNLTLYELIKESQNSKQHEIPMKMEQLSNIDILSLPGKFQPIPTRPIFFDIYESQMMYPSLDSKLKKAPSKGGWWSKIFSK